MMDLGGEWIGYYPDHFDEVIRIDRADSFWVATKITGDDYVPAGEITWRAHSSTGAGSGQIAGHGFRNPAWIPGKLTIHHPDQICFTWNNLGSVVYRRDT